MGEILNLINIIKLRYPNIGVIKLKISLYFLTKCIEKQNFIFVFELNELNLYFQKITN
jgi:hypothetical protein